MKVNKLSPVSQLDAFIRARYPVIWIVSQEENRVETAVRGLLTSSPKHQHKDVLTWTISKGVRLASSPGEQFGPQDPIQALQFVGGYGVTDDSPKGSPAVFVFRDLHPYFQHDPRVTRAFRDVITDITASQRTLIVISSTVSVPEECKRQVTVIEWPLPTIDELSMMLDDFIADLPGQIVKLRDWASHRAKPASSPRSTSADSDSTRAASLDF